LLEWRFGKLRLRSILAGHVSRRISGIVVTAVIISLKGVGFLAAALISIAVVGLQRQRRLWHHFFAQLCGRARPTEKQEKSAKCPTADEFAQ